MSTELKRIAAALEKIVHKLDQIIKVKSKNAKSQEDVKTTDLDVAQR